VKTTAVVASLGSLLLVGGCGGGGAKGPGTADAGGAPEGGGDGAGDVVRRAFPADEISGTRLRAQYWQIEDGQRVPQVSGIATPVWFDTKLGTPCVWRPSTDTTYVCAPSSPYVFQRDLYADAECKTPAGAARSYFYEWAASEAAPPPSVISGSLPFGPPQGSNELDRETSCADKGYGWDGEDVLELGAPLAATTFYDAVRGCKAVPLAPGEVARSMGRKLAPSELATAHVERDDTGHRLSTRQLVSDDGARQRIGWYDNVLGAACTVGVAADGKPRCLPDGPDAGQTLFFFSDAAGSPLGLVSVDPNPYEPGSYIRAAGEAFACGQTRLKVYRVGATYDGDIYTPGDPTPIPANAKPAGIYVHVTEIAAKSMDAFLPRTVGGRLQITALVDAEGALDVFPFGANPFGGTVARFAEDLTDSSLQQPCKLQHLPDGSIRCLPAWSRQVAGLNCTRNVVMSVQPFTMCAGDPVATFTAAWRGDACTGGYELSGFGKMIVPNSGAVGDCTVGGGPDRTTFYEIGAAAPPATFAAATLSHD
jgi:hypothetical protein